MLFLYPFSAQHNMRCTCLQFQSAPPGRIPKSDEFFHNPSAHRGPGKIRFPGGKSKFLEGTWGGKIPLFGPKSDCVNKLGVKISMTSFPNFPTPQKNRRGNSLNGPTPQRCGYVYLHTTSHASPIFGPLIWYYKTHQHPFKAMSKCYGAALSPKLNIYHLVPTI